MSLSSNEVEAANRAEACALLIRAGCRVYRPEADVAGEDLVLLTPEPDRVLVPVQLKSRLTVDEGRYGKIARLQVLFPDGPFHEGIRRVWFLVPHSILLERMRQDHGHAPKWNGTWSSANVPIDLKPFLSSYEVRPNAGDEAAESAFTLRR